MVCGGAVCVYVCVRVQDTQAAKHASYTTSFPPENTHRHPCLPPLAPHTTVIVHTHSGTHLHVLALVVGNVDEHIQEVVALGQAGRPARLARGLEPTVCVCVCVCVGCQQEGAWQTNWDRCICRRAVRVHSFHRSHGGILPPHTQHAPPPPKKKQNEVTPWSPGDTLTTLTRGTGTGRARGSTSRQHVEVGWRPEALCVCVCVGGGGGYAFHEHVR